MPKITIVVRGQGLNDAPFEIEVEYKNKRALTKMMDNLTMATGITVEMENKILFIPMHKIEEVYSKFD